MQTRTARNPRGKEQRRAGTALDLTRHADQRPENQCPSSSKISLLKDDALAFPWGPKVTPITIPVGILATESQGCNFRGHWLLSHPTEEPLLEPSPPVLGQLPLSSAQRILRAHRRSIPPLTVGKPPLSPAEA